MRVTFQSNTKADYLANWLLSGRLLDFMIDEDLFISPLADDCGSKKHVTTLGETFVTIMAMVGNSAVLDYEALPTKKLCTFEIIHLQDHLVEVTARLYIEAWKPEFLAIVNRWADGDTRTEAGDFDEPGARKKLEEAGIPPGKRQNRIIKRIKLWNDGKLNRWEIGANELATYDADRGIAKKVGLLLNT